MKSEQRKRKSEKLRSREFHQKVGFVLNYKSFKFFKEAHKLL